VAEGVEDEATAQVLRSIGVDVLQGYHFARPCPASELLALPLFINR
jgi:EAL domain-containing protein (putative c-di-GMP-specific phosphodiesterase class I)